jgi:hypothetical protein
MHPPYRISPPPKPLQVVFAAEELIRDRNRWHPPSDKLPVPPRPAPLRAAARRRARR